MASWSELVHAAPALATRAQAILYQFGVGLGFLATVDVHGGPRLHPLCPIIGDGELHLLVVPGPKRADLVRDGRFALHSFPRVDDEDAAYLTGRAIQVDDDLAVRARVERQFLDERAQFPIPPDSLAEQGLFRLDIERCMVTTSAGHGDPSPRHEVWLAARDGSR